MLAMEGATIMQAGITAIVTHPEQFFLKLFLGPVMELHSIYKKSVKRQKTDPSQIVMAVVIIAGILAGIIVPKASPEFTNSLNSILTPTTGDAFLTFYVSAWFFSFLGMEIVRNTVWIYGRCIYGDIEYYLTTAKLIELQKACDLPADDINAVFKFMREKFRSNVVTLNSRAGSLEDALEIFMYGGPMTVLEQYDAHQGFYKAALMQHANMSPINDAAKMRELATRYGVEPEHIIEVLRYCAENLRENHDAIGVRKEDYAQIISDILSGSSTGHLAFVEQQHFAIQRREKILLLQKKNQHLLDELRGLREHRDSPRFTPQYIYNPQVENTCSEQEQLPDNISLIICA